MFSNKAVRSVLAILAVAGFAACSSNKGANTPVDPANRTTDSVTPGSVEKTYAVTNVALTGESAALAKLADAKMATVTTVTAEDGTVSHLILVADLAVSTAAAEGQTLVVEMSADNVVTLRDGEATAVITLGAEQDKGQTDAGQDDKGQDDKGQDDKGQDDKGHDDKGHDDKGQDDKGQDDKGQDEKKA